MLKKLSALLLSVALLTVSLLFPSITRAQSSASRAAQDARLAVQRLGVNKDKKIEVKLNDKTRIKGYITTVDQDSFTVTDARTGATQTVSYADVSGVKKSGGGLSTKAWLILGAVATGVIVTWIFVKPAVCDGGAQSRGIC